MVFALLSVPLSSDHGWFDFCCLRQLFISSLSLLRMEFYLKHRHTPIHKHTM